MPVASPSVPSSAGSSSKPVEGEDVIEDLEEAEGDAQAPDQMEKKEDETSDEPEVCFQRFTF